MSHDYEFKVYCKQADQYDGFVTAILKKVVKPEDRRIIILKLSKVIKALIGKLDPAIQADVRLEALAEISDIN